MKKPRLILLVFIVFLASIGLLGVARYFDYFGLNRSYSPRKKIPPVIFGNLPPKNNIVFKNKNENEVIFPILNKPIPDLINDLDSPIGRLAEKNLIRLGQKDGQVIDHLIKALESPKFRIRDSVSRVLGRIADRDKENHRLGSKTVAAALALGKVLNNENEIEGIRSMACNSLGLIGPESIPVLEKAIKKSNPKFRRNILDALGRIQDKRSIAILMDHLKDEDRGVRFTASSSLGYMGKFAVPELLKGLKDQNPFVKVGCGEALLRIDKNFPEAISTLADLLSHPDPEVKSAIYFGFKDLDSLGEPAVPALMKALEDPNDGVRRSSLSTLIGIGKPAKPAVPVLIKRV